MTTQSNSYKSMTDDELRTRINAALATDDASQQILAYALEDILNARIARRTRKALKEHAAGNAARLAARLNR